MSSPPQERTLVFPLVETGELKHNPAPAEAPPAASPTPEEWMARLQNKDSSALGIIFDHYSRLALGIALRILNDYGEAEEVVQETFFYMYQKANLFDASKGTLKAWIGQIAFHRALDRKAHLARRGFYLGTDIASLDDTLLDKTRSRDAAVPKAAEAADSTTDRVIDLWLRPINESMHGILPTREFADQSYLPVVRPWACTVFGGMRADEYGARAVCRHRESGRDRVAFEAGQPLPLPIQ
jgi:DNA-directed RNA polymerase specialized sigma24 family protein